METIGPDEQRLINEIVEQMAAANLAAFNRHNHGIRDAHAKSHGFLKGTLTVHDDLDAELRQGVFAKPKRYEVVARLSSAPGDIHSDEIPAPRGFALKLIGVEGERLSPDIGGRNQDFLMVNFPVLAFGDVARYKEMLGLLEANAQAPDFFQKLVAGAARGAKDVVEALGGAPGATLEGLARNNDNPLGESYFTQGALRFGDYIGKVSIAPASPNIKALTGQ
ncbi:catalase, partial [Escherichia coli]|nr:catalase [Escherichia coli]